MGRAGAVGQGIAGANQGGAARAEGTLHTYYSYVEGLGADEHLRKNKAAEEAAVLAGNLLAMARLAGRPVHRQDALHSIWRTILKYQDHDATWLEEIDLRRKAIGKFKKSILLSRKLMAEAAQRLVEEDAASLSVFNALPQARKVLLDLPPQHLPAGIAFQQVGQRRLGFCELPAGGFRSFPTSAADGVPSREGPLPSTIVTDGYRVNLSREGLIGQLTTAAGKDLLAAGQYLGGEIRAVIDNRWVSNRRAAVKFFDGDVCAVVERSGTFGGLAAAERPAPEAGWTKEGKSAGALKLNGTSYVAAGGLGTFEQLTVAMWVKPTALDNSHQAILHSDGWETSGLHFTLLQDGRVQAAVNGAKPVEVYSLATPGKQLGKWTHLAVVYDGLAQTLNLFVDGRKDSQIALTKSVPVVLDKFRLGAWDREARSFHGLLRDVRVYRVRWTRQPSPVLLAVPTRPPPSPRLGGQWIKPAASKSPTVRAKGTSRHLFQRTVARNSTAFPSANATIFSSISPSSKRNSNSTSTVLKSAISTSTRRRLTSTTRPQARKCITTFPSDT